MKISKRAQADAKSLLRGCFADGRLDEGRVRRAVALLLEKKPRGYLAVLAHFQRRLRLEIQRSTAIIQSAIPLSDALAARVRTRLEAAYGAGLQFQFRADPAWLGGLRIQVGSDLHDGTVRGRLERLQESLSA
ncbi:MAG TPA: F0F1 ATP synthase subunit delta [Candidatus Paceibacterota bacterium]|nr:F0F1 ATP synthase subunit delta [Verrucomicrobiota bacterium]HOX02603.1 F0F1 ATP synthase subunit delta [Verrucomicrobiota bacterium]HRZ45255.1 F0F1 ATP synthase subunit delta [Candidatus Paceibacterota bacterium]HRZ92029.1 F0F1 ATP synthase subunit delta [Candidatus Paceibacterota bacterium]